MSIRPEHDKPPVIPDTMPYTPEERSLARKKQREALPWYKKTSVKLAGVGFGLLGVGTAAGAGIANMGGETNTEPRAETSASAPANPETTSDASSPEFGISASEFMNDPEALAAEYYRQENEFMIAGIGPKELDSDERFSMTDAEYLAQISAPIDEDFINKLFVKNWQDKPELLNYVNKLVEISHDTRYGRLYTDDHTVEGYDELYVREILLDQATGTTNPLTTSVRWHEQDNRDVNDIEDVLSGVDPNNEYGGETFTWVNEGGELKISNTTHYYG